MVPDASKERNAFISKGQVVKEDRIHESDITTFLENVRNNRPKEKVSYACRPKYLSAFCQSVCCYRMQWKGTI